MSLHRHDFVTKEGYTHDHDLRDHQLSGVKRRSLGLVVPVSRPVPAHKVALENIEALLVDAGTKGTQDPLLKAIRHELHKAGYLNKPETVLWRGCEMTRSGAQRQVALLDDEVARIAAERDELAKLVQQ